MTMALPEGATPYDGAFFEGQEGASLASAETVLGRVLSILRPGRILDIGCGTGPWMRAALDLGVPEVLGVDGDYVDRTKLLVPPEFFVSGNLATQSIRDVIGARASPSFDLVLCLEVAEHLPFHRAPTLIRDLTSFADVVLFSAAVPFQFGTQHVNEQWPEFWSILFRAEGFSCFDCLRPFLWAEPKVDWWYAQNALIFARDGSHAATLLPPASRVEGRGLSIVHPENLLINLLTLPRRFRLQAFAEEPGDYRSLVAANLRGSTLLPPLTAPARAATAASVAPGVFPATRIEIDGGQAEGDRLLRLVDETNRHLAAANEAYAEARDAFLRADKAFAAERVRRFELEAELERHVAELECRKADLKHREAVEERQRSQGSARVLAETRLADIEAETLRQTTERERTASERLAAEHRALQDLRAAEQAAADAEASLVRQRGVLEARLASVEAVTRSRVWRLTRRLLRLAGRAPHAGILLEEIATSSDLQPPAPPEPSGGSAAEAPREKPPIKCWDRTLGEVNWWTLAGAVTRLKRLEVFDAADYLRRNPDVEQAGSDPYQHFVQSGALEGRGRIDPEDLARLMGSLVLFDNAVRAIPNDLEGMPDLARLVADVPQVGIFVSSEGNVFMNELAEDLAEDLRSVGVSVDVLDEHAAIDDRPPICLFIAPHEFFVLGRGTQWIRDDVLSQGFVFGTEQLQTTWFNTALPFTLMARGMLDICSQTADLFARTHMAALHVLPGAQLRPHPLADRDRAHPLFGVLPAVAQAPSDPSRPFAERPIDIAFFGTSSPRRDQFFARHAGFFADYETFNYCRRPGRGPIRSESEDGVLTRLAGHVCGHSKIALNIHREEFGYFEWHRMVRLGMCTGALVVSDPCLPHPRFVANEHYLQENARQIPNLLEWLLRTEDGGREAERIRANVNRLITTTYATSRAAAEILRFLSRHRSRETGAAA